jgi:hypothetical protein
MKLLEIEPETPESKASVWAMAWPIISRSYLLKNSSKNLRTIICVL